MSLDFDYTAKQLMAISDKLKTFQSTELVLCAHTLTYIGAEIRKLAPNLTVVEQLNKLKPEPPRVDPNSMIPRPVPPPKGSGPVKLAMANGRAN